MGGVEISSYSYLTSALDGGEWSVSRPGRALYRRGKDHRYQLDRRLGGAIVTIVTVLNRNRDKRTKHDLQHLKASSVIRFTLFAFLRLTYDTKTLSL
jgi:hypothetical protein